MKLLGKRVLVQVPEVKETYGLIYIPEKAREKPQVAQVIGVADDCTQGIKVGDTVLFGKFAYVECPFGWLIYERDIQAVLSE